MWNDDHNVNDKKKIFAKPPLIMVPMLNMNGYSKSWANEVEPEENAAINAFVGPANVADE